MSDCEKCKSPEKEVDHYQLTPVMSIEHSLWANLCEECADEWRKFSLKNDIIEKLRDTDQEIEVMQYVVEVIPRSLSAMTEVKEQMTELLSLRESLSRRVYTIAKEWVLS